MKCHAVSSKILVATPSQSFPSSSQVDAKKRRNKNSPFQPKKQKFGSRGCVRTVLPYLQNGYPNGNWYLDDTVLNLAFASGIMFAYGSNGKLGAYTDWQSDEGDVQEAGVIDECSSECRQ